MRIAELSLERYGRFEGRQLTLPHREQDFHLIYGPNEAGKTTTLCAVADLLFGFEHLVNHAYRFSASALRVGAVLEAGGEHLSCRRRRGKTGTLVDAADAPLDEGRLIAMLGGISRDAFLQSSSLDHARLRAGGRAMVESRNDLGQMLFTAGSGATNVKQVLDSLDRELDALWGQRRSERRAFSRAEVRWKEARTGLRDAAVRPADWLKAKSELDLATKAFLQADAARQRAALALPGAERLRRVFPLLGRRRDLVEAIAKHPGVAMSETVEATAREALDAAAEHQQKRHTAEQLLASARQRLEAEPDQSPVLSLADEIDRLVQDMSAEQERRTARPALGAEIDTIRAEIGELAVQLELEAETARTTSLPAPGIIQKLRELASRRVALATRVSTTEQAANLARAEVEAADQALTQAEPPAVLDQLQTTVTAAQRAGELDEQIQKQEALVSKTGEALAQALRALLPWAGDVQTLATLVTPLEDEVDQAATTADTLAQRAADAARLVSERAEALELARAKVEAARRTQGVVPLDTLLQARTDRDQSVDRVAQHLAGEAILPSPMEEVEQLRRTVSEADALADRRFAAADATAQLAAAEAEVTQAEIRHRNAQEQSEKLTSELERSGEDWLARLRLQGLPELQPDALRGWLRRRVQCLVARDMHEDAKNELLRLKSRRDGLLRELRAVVEIPQVQHAEALEPALAEAATRLEALRRTAAAFDALKSDSRNANARRDEALRGAQAALQQLQDWQAGWDAFNAEVGLSLQPMTAEVRLSAWEALARSRERLEELRRRLDHLDTSAQDFAARAVRVARDLGLGATDDALEVARKAKAALEAARAASARRRALQDEVDSRDQERAAAAAALDAAETALAEAFTTTRSSDRLSLAAALDHARDRRNLEGELKKIDDELALQADGQPIASLEAECAEASYDLLSARAEEARTELEQASQAAIAANGVMSEAAVRFKRFEGQQDAANWASELELARAELDSLAETYILKKAQRLLLGHAMKRQAERARHPLLKRAAELFQTLTLKRYADLIIDREADKPRLLGVCDDGQSTIQIDDMSEGTQDQLFLALRLAAVEQAMSTGSRLPFLADDLFVTFDDDRARSGLQVLGELSRTTQVLFFTHHAHLRDLAETLFPSLSVHDLQEAT